jgi:hypothetical protein
LHRAEDVEAIQTASNSEIRSRLLEFSNLLALQLVGKEPVEAKTIIDAEVRKVLNKLREFNPRDYYHRSKTLELDQEPQPEKEAVKKAGWPKGKPQPKGPRPWVPESNRQRWASH